MRDLKTDEKYEVVISLRRNFANLTTNDDLERTLKSFHGVLTEGGLLLFDTFNAEDGMKYFDKHGKTKRRFIIGKGREIVQEPETHWHLKHGVAKLWKTTYVSYNL